MDQLKISEIFTTIQGEGPFMGRPATFIRLSGCTPPFCPWCDTKHAQKEGETIPVDQIVEKCVSFEKKLIVITGGEPFLQWDSGLKLLDDLLNNKGFKLQYETSGKVVIPHDYHGVIVCSPKFLVNRWQIHPENIARCQYFKFVVVDDDFEEIENFIAISKIPKNKVWFMAEGAKRDHQLLNSVRVWEYCTTNNYNFSPRMHILVFDDKKGV